MVYSTPKVKHFFLRTPDSDIAEQIGTSKLEVDAGLTDAKEVEW